MTFDLGPTCLTPKQRLKILEKVFKESNTVASVCRDFGISATHTY